MTVQVTTVADDEVVVFEGGDARHYEGLTPGTEHELDGIVVRTLDRPSGELICRFATVNDVHFGEVECGVLDDFPTGPIVRAEPGDPPYPEVMNQAAISNIAAIDPAAVVVKGDLTDRGTDPEYADFLAAYQPAFGERLVHVRGNHDAYHGGTYAAWPMQRVDMPGVCLALLDTTVPGSDSGHVSTEQLEWLDDLAATAATGGSYVVVMGHHHPWDPSSRTRPLDYFGINPDASEALIDVIARRESIVGYTAGHTHRNRVRRFAPTGGVPYVEVGCVKDFPGMWAEYRVYEGGILQIGHRIEGQAALAWTERTRCLYGGLYEAYSPGSLADRCLELGRHSAG